MRGLVLLLVGEIIDSGEVLRMINDELATRAAMEYLSFGRFQDALI